MTSAEAYDAVPDRGAAAEHSGLSRENSIYRRTMAVCDESADAALGGADPVRLTEVFAQLVGKRIVLLDTGFRLRAQAGGSGSLQGLRWNRTDPSVDRLLSALEAARRPLRIPAIPGSLLDQACLVTPVVVRDTILGYLLVLTRSPRPAVTGQRRTMRTSSPSPMRPPCSRDAGPRADQRRVGPALPQ